MHYSAGRTESAFLLGIHQLSSRRQYRALGVAQWLRQQCFALDRVYRLEPALEPKLDARSVIHFLRFFCAQEI
jgi:hypothetical protein